MNRMIAAAVAVLGLTCGAFAAGPVKGVVAPGCADCGATGGAGYAPAAGWGGGGCKDCDPKFGLNPFFKKLLFWKKDTGCGTCGRGLFGNCAGTGVGAGVGGHGAAFNPYPGGVPGTLVFPHNPYIRSPRDWFMQDR